MSTMTSMTTPGAETFGSELVLVRSTDDAILVEADDQSAAALEALMRVVLVQRDAVRATRKRVRDSELGLRQAASSERPRFERIREASLQEHRAAQVAAMRSRQRLVAALGERRVGLQQ
jgi:hypothetical protein